MDVKRLSPGKRAHLRWLVSPQGRKYGTLEALRASVGRRLMGLTADEVGVFLQRMARVLRETP